MLKKYLLRIFLAGWLLFLALAPLLLEYWETSNKRFLLLKELDDSDWRVQKKASQTLLSLRDPSLIEALRTQYERKETRTIGSVILLGKLGDFTPGADLLKWLQNDEFFMQHPQKGAEIIEALISWHSLGFSTEEDVQKILPCLMKSLHHPAKEVRASAIQALRWFEVKSSIPALMVASADPSLEVRFQAIRSLRFLKASGPAVLSIYNQRFQEKEDSLRLEIIQALGESQEVLPESIPILCQFLSEKNH
ncbi:MAG: HEAT repeat domain-containing protein, partial [Planctomycetota bacterium]